MPQFTEWLPQIVIAALPGVINIWLSSIEQARTLRKYPFFQSWKSPRLWWLRTIQFVLPVALFWWVAPAILQIPPPCLPSSDAAGVCQIRPVDVALIGNAIAFGWGFVALLNAPIDILSAGMLPIGSMYNFFIEQICEKIYKDQQTKMFDLWQQIEDELIQVTRLPSRGINLLSEYLDVPSYQLNDSNLDVDPTTKDLIAKINTIQNPNLSSTEKARQITKLLRTEAYLDVQQLQKLTKALGCREQSIPALFPQQQNQPQTAR